MEICQELQKLLTKNTETCVIITRGADPVILASGKIPNKKTKIDFLYCTEHGVKMFTVKRPSKIVDTTGCGDAFVGGRCDICYFLVISQFDLGFLAYKSLNKSIDDCINAACYCAYECLLQTGCQFLDNPSINEAERFCEIGISC
jgi:sugar/nucleoside kinase (ribokinase family)